MIQPSYFWIYIQIKLKEDIKDIPVDLYVIAALFTIVKIWKQPKYP